MKTMISNTRSLSGRGHRLHLQADRQLYYPISFFSIRYVASTATSIRRLLFNYIVLYGIRARVVWLCDSSIYGFARTKVKNRRAQRLNVSAHMVSAIIYTWSAQSGPPSLNRTPSAHCTLNVLDNCAHCHARAASILTLPVASIDRRILPARPLLLWARLGVRASTLHTS